MTKVTSLLEGTTSVSKTSKSATALYSRPSKELAVLRIEFTSLSLNLLTASLGDFLESADSSACTPFNCPTSISRASTRSRVIVMLGLTRAFPPEFDIFLGEDIYWTPLFALIYFHHLH